ncbi:MAG TPA: TraB/GumN family protein, partial [Bacteroidia bacterium]|nr:TraB/GumN family protein [Bacteroidia bacterium]
ETEFSVDGFFKNEARKKGKTLLGIETIQEAQKAVDEIPLAEQCKTMVDFFRNYDTGIKSLDTLIVFYQNQDLKGINNYYMSHIKELTAFNKKLVVARNKIFLDKLISLMKTQSVFCAVGTLHLPGESGLINQLQKKGYKVTPVFSKYTPHTLYLDDKRDWGYYEENNLLFSMRLPVDPTYQADTSDATNATTYYEDDSLLNMGFVLVGAKIDDSAMLYNDELLYKNAIDRFNKTENWKQVAQRDVMYKDIKCKDVEYNIEKGSNVLYRVCKREGYLYCFGVSGNKKLLYSDKANYFFDNIEFMFPPVYFELSVNDELSNQGIKEFNVQVTSNTFDTTFTQDTVGLISLNLPSGAQNKYILSVSAKNYVTKKIELNTANVIKTGKNEIYINGEVALMKKKPNVDYSVFDAPVAKARMMSDNTFSWDIDYIKTQKEIIAKKFKPAAPGK